MKKLLPLIISLLLPLVANAEAVKIEKLYYNLLPDKGYQAEVTQSPNMDYSGEIIIPSTVSHDGHDYTVVTITPRAFQFSQITKVEIPNSITTIGEAAFEGCRSLTEVKLPDNLTEIPMTMFAQCENLKEIQIPLTVTSIGMTAFSMSGIETIVIPNSVVNIGSQLFDGCKKLKNVTLPANMEVIPTVMFKDCTSLEEIILPSKVREIEWEAFRGCTRLSYISLPKDMQEIKDRAFADCPNLFQFVCEATSVPNTGEDVFNGAFLKYATLYVPDAMISSYARNPWSDFGQIVSNSSATRMPTPKVTEDNVEGLNYILFEKGLFAEVVKNENKTGNVIINPTITYEGNSYSVIAIAARAFQFSQITKVEIPNSITTIGEAAFEGCRSLTEVKLPDNLTEIPMTMFAQCENLKEIQIPSTVTNIGMTAFSMTGIEKIDIPNSVVKIGSQLFDECRNLKEVKLSTMIETIPVSTFHNCTSLEVIVVPDNVRTIENMAFSGCTQLAAVALGLHVSEIMDEAFSQCPNMSQFRVNASSVPNVANSAFNDSRIQHCTLYVPNNMISTYASRNIWKDFGNIDDIENAPAMPTGGVKSATIDGILYNLFENGYVAEVAENKKCSGAISIPQNVTFEGQDYEVVRITARAFQGSKITKINIANSVTTIGEAAFESSRRLTEAKLPDNLTEIPMTMFAQCENLKKISIPSTVTSIGMTAFAMTGIDTLVIPNSVVNIGSQLFEGCENLRHVQFSDKIRSLPISTFRNCTSLEVMLLPENIKTIEHEAFAGCTQLIAVSMGKYLEEIQEQAFAQCANLLHVRIYSPSVNKCANDAFDVSYINYATLYVPNAMIGTYSPQEPWKNFKEIKEALPWVVYFVDDKYYDLSNYAAGDAVTALAEPTKAGYTFSGWNGVPTTMPSDDVIVTGSFQESSGIQSMTTNDRLFDVYNLQGQKVKSKVSTLNGLPKGVYIINGKKQVLQ